MTGEDFATSLAGDEPVTRDDLIKKLADTMDPDHAREMVEECFAALTAERETLRVERDEALAETEGWVRIAAENARDANARESALAAALLKARTVSDDATDLSASEARPHGPVSERFMRHHYGASGYVPPAPPADDTLRALLVKADSYLSLLWHRYTKREARDDSGLAYEVEQTIGELRSASAALQRVREGR